MIPQKRRGYLPIIGVALIIVSLSLQACQSGEEPPAVQELQQVGASTPDTKQGTTSTIGSGQQALGTPEPGATGTANVDISPAEVAVGNVVLTLGVQPAQPAFDPTGPTSGSPGSDQQNSDQQKPGVARRGFTVLGGAGTKITNNFDNAQNPPADQAREVLRHVAVQIKDKTSGQLIPYILVSMDLLREGRPVLQDQPLIPMLEVDSGVSQMHYGNNVKFPGRGDYQIFVRMERSPLLGSGPLGVAQFNVSIR